MLPTGASQVGTEPLTLRRRLCRILRLRDTTTASPLVLIPVPITCTHPMNAHPQFLRAIPTILATPTLPPKRTPHLTMAITPVARRATATARLTVVPTLLVKTAPVPTAAMQVVTLLSPSQRLGTA